MHLRAFVIPRSSSDGCKNLLAAAVGHFQVVFPVARGFGELVHALEGIVPQRGGEALVEPGSVAPHPQHAVLERNAVRPAHTARGEVLQDQAVAVLRRADDADRLRDSSWSLWER